ncbi:MAG: prolyl oligopeptidase family serine peptidase, partial [Thermoanaerobaculia bacterium]
FVYNCLEDVDNPYSTQVKFHKLGRHHRQDPVLFEQYKEGPLATTWGPRGYADDSGRWLILIYHTGTESNDLWFYDFQHWLETGELERRDVMVGEKAAARGPVAGDTLFLQTTLDAPNGRVMAVDLKHPGRDHWREIVPERRDAVVEDVSLAKGLLTVSYVAKAATRIDIFDLDGNAKDTLDLPGLGSGRLRTEADRAEAFFTFQSYHLPRTVYRVDLATGARAVWAASELPVTPDAFTVEQVTYRSKDGTPVTMFLTFRKGLVRDGGNPTLLTGYGGFNSSQTPRFRARFMPWLEAGGVLAVANLRGGGEYGESWHRAGMLDHKQNVFDDFIAAAEWLIESRYTNTGQLGIWGGSNGGLLTGAALVQRPELFSAVISAVPLLDMLRYQNFLMARFWVPEYGTAENPDQLPFLLAYSPYHNVEKGVKYPAVLLTAGENDARVHPLHARKMAARLQAATVNDVEREPILLWVEGQVGHGRGKPLAIRQRESADSLAFMGWQLGLSWDDGSAAGHARAAPPAPATEPHTPAEPKRTTESRSAGSESPPRE